MYLRSGSFQAMVVMALLLLMPLAGHAKIKPFVEDQDDEWGGLDAPFQMDGDRSASDLFGQLGEDDVDAVTFTFEEPVAEWQVWAMVPDCPALSDFAPVFALLPPELDLDEVGPEDLEAFIILPQPADENAADAGGADQEGGPSAQADNELIWEMFGQLYRVHEPPIIEIPAAGAYTLVVWEGEGRAGAYLVSVYNEALPYDPAEPIDEDTADLITSGGWMGTACDG